ncbi:MAG: type III-B CRISPR module RAMP protein Cmr4 [Candidatus Bipolaricaulia bacterium]
MNYKLQRFLLMTLDPVHIGTGGYRLGRVDNSIVREPGTKLPKIPGTSLNGAIRAYAAYRYESPQCAGQGSESQNTDYEGHCGEKECPICYTFGSLKTKNENGDQQAYAGVVNFFDAHVLFFPVHSMAGPVWVSTSSHLRDWNVLSENDNEVNLEDGQFVTSLDWDKPLNLGWLMLEKDQTTPMPDLSIPFDDENKENERTWNAIKGRLVLVTDKVFSQIVNSNLEVRTSVAIDPTTGAAQEGALFTYEAIPRATWLVTDVVEDCYRTDSFPKDAKSKVHQRELGWQTPLDVVTSGLRLTEHLGVGGMGTRGFGRVRLLTDWTLSSTKGEQDG